jgi:hypothetical protein
MSNSKQTITCPSCRATIDLSDALSSEVQEQLQGEIEARLEKQMQARSAKQVQQLQEQLAERTKALAEQQRNELSLRKRARELEEKQRQLELEVARKLDAERQLIINKVRQEESEAGVLKLREKDEQLSQLKKTIEDLRRQSQQGSMQIQGEVQEDSLKESLQAAFVMDSIEDVATGARGADLVQKLNGKLGSSMGVIIWESKNTKAFSDSWLAKLKNDQGLVKANVAILVTQVLPEGIDSFGQKNGIWITKPAFALPLAASLRSHLLELHKAQLSLSGRDEKMAVLYSYLSSQEFRHHIESMVMAFVSMKEDLEAEKRSLLRIWSKREKEIDRLIGSTGHLYGDLQGIIGGALPSIPQLELPEG